ncbi:sulfite exporter TauE/SafE family protein [Alteromonas sp. CYL-A6]|uniref:sulfite exporter TauE/SafE family protein n=1 Tax=Alteromonas nitratireducens TaxID=3390813 RepID=UPI0034C440B5
MTELTGLSALLIGLAGGVHCIGMCGGIVTALQQAVPARRRPFPYMLAYNLGRIISYTLAGALAGGVGQMSAAVLPALGQVLAWLSALMLVALALYLGQWWRGLAYLEKAGNAVWRLIQPLSKRFLPFRSPLAALPYGLIWGWLPCGLVYSTLTWSLTSQQAGQGAFIMFCFGLGTLPTLLAVGSGADYLFKQFRKPRVRQFIASGLLIYSFFLIYRLIHSITIN